MPQETRNQRRSRRRAETSDERLNVRIEQYIERTNKLPILVFSHWVFGGMVGYVYNHEWFPNGTRIQTASVTYESSKFNRLIVITRNSTYRVEMPNDKWKQVGAGHALNRLKYKLWPKLVLIALYRRVVNQRFMPGGTGYYECLHNFAIMAMYQTSVKTVQH